MTGSRDGTITSWDTATGRRVSVFTGPAGGIEKLAVDPAGRWLIAVGSRGVWRWDLRTKPAATKSGQVVSATGDPVWSVAFSADGAMFATSTENGKVQIYDTESAAPVGKPFTHSVDFLSVAFSRDGSKVLAGTGDGRVFIWDIASHQQSGEPIDAHGTNDVWELVMHPDGDRFATGSSDGTTKVWSLASHQQVARPFEDSAGNLTIAKVEGLVWIRDGAVLVAGGGDGRLHEWDLAKRVRSESARPVMAIRSWLRPPLPTPRC